MAELRDRSGLKILGAVLLALAVAGCSLKPVRPSDAHIRAEEPRVEGAIPPPVQLATVLPAPKPAPRQETYSVVVNSVRVQDLLFALARDAKLNIDIAPGITGSVTLNAIDQTLPQLLNRISKQVDLRYELDGPNLIVMRDTPYLQAYKVDYLSATRNVRAQSLASTQFVGGTAAGGTAGGGAAGAGGGAGTGSLAQIIVTSENQLWESIVKNIRELLQETDKIIPAAGAAAAPAAAAPASGGANAPAPAGGQPAAQPAAEPSTSFREAASVIGNRESGVLYVRATSRQHEKVREFLDQVLANAKRQVLIEATVAEVQLNNQYQRGIDWQRVRPAGSNSGFTFQQSPAPGTPAAAAGLDTTTGFILGYAAPGLNIVVNALKLLESFGDVRVLSSPKISVLNNQTALLRVTRDIVYFTITPSTQPITIAGGGLGGVTLTPTFTTTPNVAAEGFMMSVLPQINDTDTVVINVRPTIRRQIAFATDPNPALSAATPNRIPVFETRELDSMLRIQSGQIAVLGGLMQDSLTNTEDTIPGVRNVPGLGQLLAQRAQAITKTELVIFLRATVVRDPSLEGDFERQRALLPDADFFRRPNPGRGDAPAAAPAATSPAK